MSDHGEIAAPSAVAQPSEAKRRPPQEIRIDGSIYKGLGLENFKLGDRVKFVLMGEVTGIEEPVEFEEGIRVVKSPTEAELRFRLEEVTNLSPPAGSDFDRRLISEEGNL